MILNNELKLPVPEGFHVMDEEEVSRLRPAKPLFQDGSAYLLLNSRAP